MTRMTIDLPADLKARAEARARAERISFEEYVRRSLDEALRDVAPAPKPKGDQRRQRDPLFADDFVSHDQGPGDLAENHDKYLLQMLDQEMQRWRKE